MLPGAESSGRSAKRGPEGVVFAVDAENSIHADPIAGFRESRVGHLGGPDSMTIGIKEPSYLNVNFRVSANLGELLVN